MLTVLPVYAHSLVSTSVDDQAIFFHTTTERYYFVRQHTSIIEKFIIRIIVLVLYFTMPLLFTHTNSIYLFRLEGKLRLRPSVWSRNISLDAFNTGWICMKVQVYTSKTCTNCSHSNGNIIWCCHSFLVSYCVQMSYKVDKKDNELFI